MGHHSCCNQQKVKRGLWSPEEDEKLVRYITTHGYGCWSEVPEKAGLQRCGKSCRLRWINYLRPDIKRGNFTADEEDQIIRLHHSLGNRWSAIAAQLPGRTDNEIKNVWHTHLKKRLLEDNQKTTPGDGGRRQKKRKQKAKATKSAPVSVKHEQLSPGRSSSSVTYNSTVTETAAPVSSSPAITSASHQLVKEESFSSAVVTDDSFWFSTDVTGMMNLGSMEEELSLAPTRNEDMDFWLKMFESGDMRDLAVS